MFKYLLYKFGQWLVNILPLKLSYTLARFLCNCHYLISIRDRRSVEKNLRIILGDREDIPNLTREVFHNFGLYLVEFFRLKRMVTDEFVKDHVVIDSLDHLKKAVERNRGAIILSAHLGNWELGGALLGKLGYPLTIIALAHKERTVDSFFNRQREIVGNKVVPTTQAIRKCTEALENKELVAIAADRDFSQSGEEMEFFGRKTVFPKGAAIFSLRQNVPIVPIFFIREGDANFRLDINEAILPKPIQGEEIKKEDMDALMRGYVKIIEAKIRQYPTQWLMFREFSVS